MYHLIKDIVDYCKNENMEFWQVVQAADIRESGEHARVI